MGGFVSAIFGGGKPPAPPAPPPTPTAEDPAIKEKEEEIKKRALAAKGRASTILVGALGDSTDNSGSAGGSKTLG